MNKASTTAPGFGNWSYKDFQELYRDSDNPHAPAGVKAWPKTLACIVNMTAQGVLDRGRLAPALASVRGIVIPKDDEGNVRPLGVASPFCSLTAALLRDDREVKEKMRELVDFCDLSHGIKGGSESVSHILRAATVANPSHIVLKVDFRNAFNSIPRQRVVDIATKIPALGPFIKLVYNCTTHVFFKCGVHLATNVGVTQGDPLGGFLFSAVLTDALKGIVIPDCTLLFRFADDTYIVGPPAEAFLLMERVKVLAAEKAGLTFQPTKSTMWVPAAAPDDVRATATGLANGLQLKVRDGVIAGGAAVGTDAFVTAHLQKVIQMNVHPRDLVRNYSFSDEVGAVQNSFALFRWCINPALYTYLLRTHPPSLVEPLLAQVDTDMERAVLEMAAAPTAPWDDTEATAARFAHSVRRMHLHPEKGGMGIPELARMAKYAYLGSIALAGPVLRELLTHYPRYPAINDPALVFQEATALINAGTASAADIDSIDQLYILGKPVFQLQRTLWRAQAQGDYEAVRDASADKITRALVLSQACPESSAFLFTTSGRDRHLRLTNQQMRIGVRDYLGLPTTDFFSGNRILHHMPGQMFRCTGCNPMEKPLRKNMLIDDDLGRHSLICGYKSLRGARSHRHLLFCHALEEAVFQKHHQHPDGSNRVEREPNLENLGFVLQHGHQQPPAGQDRIVRGDFLLTRANGQRTLVDVTTTAVGKVSAKISKASRRPGYPARAAARTKTGQYKKKWIIPDNVPLFIAAFEMTGRWSKKTASLVDSYLSHKFPDKDYSKSQSNGFSAALDYARKRISVNARICVASAVMALTECAHAGVLVPVDAPPVE
jgi:hypothetical protein